MAALKGEEDHGIVVEVACCSEKTEPRRNRVVLASFVVLDTPVFIINTSAQEAGFSFRREGALVQLLREVEVEVEVDGGGGGDGQL